MNCEKLQRELPDIMDGTPTTEQDAHLKSCPTCSGLLSDLALISEEARLLRESEEPSPRVWNAIEIALREEGLIHQPRREPAVSLPRRWSPGWMLPVAVAFLLTIGVARYRMPPSQPAQVAQRAAPPVETASLQHPAGQPAQTDDEQLLEVVGSRSPALRADYAADLKNVDAYIRDAEESAHTNPNDEEAQRYLMGAYEQKAMVYEMALNRSLP
jgi:hypothetical protein